MPPNSDIVPAAGFRTTRLPSPPTCRFLASLHLTLEHHEVVHQLLHARARRRRELLGRRVIHSLSGIAELVGSPRQRPSLPQQRRDRLRRRRLRPVHGVGGHALIVGHALDCAARHKLPTSDRAQRSRCCKRTRPRQSPDPVVATRVEQEPTVDPTPLAELARGSRRSPTTASPGCNDRARRRIPQDRTSTVPQWLKRSQTSSPARTPFS
jgi:hypothetical protein